MCPLVPVPVCETPSCSSLPVCAAPQCRRRADSSVGCDRNRCCRPNSHVLRRTPGPGQAARCLQAARGERRESHNSTADSAWIVCGTTGRSVDMTRRFDGLCPAAAAAAVPQVNPAEAETCPLFLYAKPFLRPGAPPPAPEPLPSFEVQRTCSQSVPATIHAVEGG